MQENNALNKFIRFFVSMKFSMVLLAGVIVLCVAGSLVNDPAAYFRRWYALAIAAVLCLNLLLCSVRRFPVSLRNFRRAEVRKVGAFGTWLCHLGMLLVILGFTAGQFLSEEHSVYGIAGSLQPIADTGYFLRIDDFEVRMRDDFTVDQYVAKLTMLDAGGAQKSGEASVNHPMEAFGWELYQDSTGWANTIDIYKDSTFQRSDIVCAGEYTYPDDRPELQLYFNKFYPDLVRTDDGQLATETPLPTNPHSLFTIYYKGDIMGMDVTAMDTGIHVNEYTFVMRDPQPYTLIVIKKDPTALLVGIAAGLMLAGIFLSFYWRPVYPAAETEETNHDESVSDES